MPLFGPPDVAKLKATGDVKGLIGALGVPPICPADSNCDGYVNWRDIDFFVAAMSGCDAWGDMFLLGKPTCSYLDNDVNGDCTVNWRDIDPFVARIGAICP